MAKNTKAFSGPLASEAAKVLRDPNASKVARSLAASVLSQAAGTKQTGAALEDVASKVLDSAKYSETTKSLAGSVLSQSNKGR